MLLDRPISTKPVPSSIPWVVGKQIHQLLPCRAYEVRWSMLLLYDHWQGNTKAKDVFGFILYCKFLNILSSWLVAFAQKATSLMNSRAASSLVLTIQASIPLLADAVSAQSAASHQLNPICLDFLLP